jgi:uncharacterized membrane protein SirB2
VGVNLYLAVKHLHVLCVVLSAVGFFLRGVLVWRDSPVLQHRLLRVIPHVNDALLLAAALTLAGMSGQYPFFENWLTAKVFGLIGYIILGSLALKAGRGKSVRLTCWGLALLVYGYVVSVAMTRDPWGFMASLSG